MSELPADLALLRNDLAAAKLPARRARFVLVTAVALGVLAAAAYAASRYLGQPAPAHVKASFARLAAWQPTARVDPATAKVLAFSAHTVLYGASSKGGGRCLEVVATGGFEYELFCDSSRGAPSGLLLYSPLFPIHGTAGALPPVAVTGRLSGRGRTLEARTPDGHVQHVKLGLDGFFTFEPIEQTVARRGRLSLIERDGTGGITGRVGVPAQLVLDSHGSPIRRVDGLIADPRARYALFELWSDQRSGRARKCIGVCPPEPGTLRGTTYSATVDHTGHFTLTVPRQRYRNWWLTVEIVDKHFTPLDPKADFIPVPDAAYWRRAAAEARP